MKDVTRVISAACLALIVSAPAAAETWRLSPGDGIQTAIYHAAAGDTILLARGRYH